MDNSSTFQGYTFQQAFDRMVAHLAQQKRRSVLSRSEAEAVGVEDPVFCAYRGAKGRSCVVGCLIPDSEYSPELEGGGVSALPRKLVLALIPEAGSYEKAAKFLERAQDIHDNAEERGKHIAQGMAGAFTKLAYDYDLNADSTGALARVVWQG